MCYLEETIIKLQAKVKIVYSKRYAQLLILYIEYTILQVK